MVLVPAARVGVRAVYFVAGIVAVRDLVALPVHPYALLTVGALELTSSAFLGLAILFVTFISTVSIAITPPPLHHAMLLVLAPPSSLRALHVGTVLVLVAAVSAVGVAIAPPCLGQAVAICTLLLVLLVASFHKSGAVSLVVAIGAI